MLYLPSVQQDFTLQDVGELSKLSLKQGLTTFRRLCDYLLHLPYRRPFSQTDGTSVGKTPIAVFEEGCGTCSSKHSVLKAIAEEHGRDDVELMLVFFLMSNSNTTKIGDAIRQGPLTAIPEAHNYIRWGEEAIDITKPGLHVLNLQTELLEERVISLGELSHKRDLHRDWLNNWLQAKHPRVSLESAWLQREACIAALAEH